MKLEEQLKTALRRIDPPEGFAERVIQQAGPARVSFRRAAPNRRGWFAWASIPAAAAVVAIGLVEHRRSQEELAAKQAIQALQLVAEELNIAQNEVLNK